MADMSKARALLAAGDLAAARALAERACAAAPERPGPHALMARVAEAEGRHAAAMAAWLEAASRAGDDPQPWRELGRLSLEQGRLAEAETALTHAVRRAPRHAATRRALAAALAQAGKPASALPELLAAVSLGAPAALLVEAGNLAWRAQDRRKAVAIWTLATEREPTLHLAWAKLARGRHALGLRCAAADAAATAARLQPDGNHHHLHGLLAMEAGRIDIARAAFRRHLAGAPDDPSASWALAACVPIVCASSAEERAVLARYDTDLARVAALHAANPDDARWPDAVQTAFPLHYLADDHKERQAAHGRLVAAACAGVPTPPRGPRVDSRVHVVVVSAYLRDHTVHKLFTGWARHLDRRRFRVTALACPGRTDGETAAAAAAVDHFARLPADLPGALAAVAAQAPDVLLFPELGMDPQVLRIASHRLAPVQAVAWGHPITTGLQTIDLFLSSAAMETGGDWTHEQRVDLPGLGLDLVPCAPPSTPRSRAQLGLPEDRTLLLSVQTLSKYRARADALHARIARAAPEALLVFIVDRRPPVTAAFRARMTAAFASAGLDLDAHVRLLPRQDGIGWRSLLLAGDLFLDSPDWSGGNTTLEALSLGLPVLAFPGRTMRGRHSLGIVREAGLPPRLSPDTEAAWVDAAVALARDPQARAELRRALAENTPRLFADHRGTRALEAALLDALREAGIPTKADNHRHP